MSWITYVTVAAKKKSIRNTSLRVTGAGDLTSSTRKKVHTNKRTRFHPIDVTVLVAGCLAVLISLAAMKVFVAEKIDVTIVVTIVVTAAVTITVIRVCLSTAAHYIAEKFGKHENKS